MSKKLILGGWCVFFSLVTSAQTQDSLRDVIPLNEVVVSAFKIPLERKETAKQVQVITSRQIRSSEGKDLAQLLNEQSGIIINGAYSNPGKDKSVFIRGASSAAGKHGIFGYNVGYSRDMAGLLKCYTLAIPFFKNMLAANLIYSAILFGVFELAKVRFKILRSPQTT